MKNKKTVIIISIIIIATVIISASVIGKKSRQLNNFKYDILVERHRYQYEGVDSVKIPAGGYSTNYYYTFINSERKEKYTIVYTDVWEIHNKRGNVDSIRISTEKVEDSEIQEYINKYGKNDKMLNLKKILDEDIKEKYTITFNDKKENDVIVTEVNLEERAWINSLTKINIKNTNDYFEITEKVKWEIPEHEKGTTVSFSIAVPYTFVVDGVSYNGIYELNNENSSKKDEGLYYNLRVVNLTKDGKIEIEVTK